MSVNTLWTFDSEEPLCNLNWTFPFFPHLSSAVLSQQKQPSAVVGQAPGWICAHWPLRFARAQEQMNLYFNGAAISR